MRALFRVIAAFFRYWLNTVRGRSATERLEKRVDNDHPKARAHEAATETQTDEAEATPRVEEEQVPASSTGGAAPDTGVEVAGISDDVPNDDFPGQHTSAERSQETTGRREEDPEPVDKLDEDRTFVEATIGAETTPLEDGDSGKPDGARVSSGATTGKAKDSDNGIEGEVGVELTSGRGQDVDTVEEPYEPAAQPGDETGDMRVDEESDLQVTTSKDRPHNDDDTGPNRSERVGTSAAKPALELVDERGADSTGHETIDPKVGSDHADPPDADAPEDLDALERASHEVSEDERGNDGAGAQAVEPELVRAGDAGVAQAGAEDWSPTPEPSDVTRPVPTTPTRNRQQRRRSPQYRAPPGGLVPSRQSPRDGTTGNNGGASLSRSRPASIEVRVLFEHGGYCTVSLLAKRPPGLPEELTVSSGAGEAELVALQDEWYQDVVPDKLADLLRRGFVWTDRSTGQEWLLSGREVFVLAAGTAHRGFVSCPRLVLGRDHVVLCATTRLPAVEEVLRETGCAGWTQLGEDDGVPIGWTVLRRIVPQQPVPLGDNADILNVLRPLPEIEIALEGGVRLAYNSWLVGHPPTIRVYGDPEHTEKVLIDGQEAVTSSKNRYTAPGWDEAGPHQVWCSNTTKSYSLDRCETSWRVWPAYSFPFPGSRKDSRGLALCGPLVRPFGDPDAPVGEPGQREGIQIPSSNPILLGPQPGQVLVAHRRTDVRGAQCVAFPLFAPVWALPAQPLLCDKRINCIFLVGQPVAASSAAALHQKTDRRAIERWSRLILDSSRKGLAVEPASLAAVQLWRQYKRHAKGLWRRLR